MIKNSKHIIVVLLIPLFVGASCIKNDLEEIDDNLVFNPEYSIPIGSKEITLEELVGSVSDLSMDTFGLPKEYIFLYDTNYYQSPGNLSLRDYIDFEFNKLSKNFGSIESLMLRVNTYNGIPTKSKIIISFLKGNDAYFLDGHNGFEVEPADYTNNDIIIPFEKLKNDYHYDNAKINKELMDVNRIYIRVEISLENPTNEIIEYQSTQSLKVQLALRFSFESTSNEI